MDQIARPQVAPEQVQQVSSLVAQYIAEQRERFSPQAAPLAPRHREAFSGFFDPKLLDAVRVLALHGTSRVENPPFYPMLAGMGFSNLPDFGQMVAVIFRDSIVSHGPIADVLLFPELAHVEPRRQLGIRRLSELYVRGFLSSGRYDGIRLSRTPSSFSSRRECHEA